MLGRSSIRLLAGAARRGEATATGLPSPPPPPPRSDATPDAFLELAKQFQPLLGMLAGAFVVGGLITAASFRNDIIASRLEEKMRGLEGKLGEKMNSLEGKLGEKMAGLEGKMNATMADVVQGAADKAKAATLEVFKDYKISVLGMRQASKSQ